MADTFDMIAKTFFGLEGVLADELERLGASDVRPGRRMVSFRGDLSLLYRANIHCRTAVRILRPISTFEADDERALYDGIRRIDWTMHLDADGSLAIDPVVHSPHFSNSLYAAQLAKDAIVDEFRDREGRRPAVDLVDPRLRINLHIAGARVTVYLDASADSLHKRGYRTAAGEAPLNEVLAAGILRLADWDERSPLSDFMCGSGTLVIEAALAARRIAPGTIRRHFGYMRWKDFDPALHRQLMREAQCGALAQLDFPLQGSDLDERAIADARENAERAGVARDIAWLVENFEQARPPANSGTLVTNPPYDVRMKTEQLGAVYARIGEALKRNWAGHTAFVLAGNAEAARQIALKPSGRIRLFNGPIECRLLKFELRSSSVGHAEGKRSRPATDPFAAFANRLARMARHWHRWARRQNIEAYRVYDRDLPEVALAIDWLAGYVLVTPYRRRHARTLIEQTQWLDRAVEMICGTLEVPRDRVVLVGSHAGPRRRPIVVQACEGDLRFEVDLAQPIDRQWDLDGRLLRAIVRDDARGARCLSLFAGAGAYTLAAAVGGAVAITSVEADRALVEQLRHNLALNALDDTAQRIVCQDPLEFVDRLGPKEAFDLVVVRAPSFDGRRREGVWNVQDGHVELLNRLVEHLSPGGKIYLTTGFRRLTLHPSRIVGVRAREITRQTIPPDFRDAKVHRAWRLLRFDDV